MKQSHIFACLSILAGCLINQAQPAKAQAEPQLGLAISPPTFELSGNPGDTIKNTLRVENLNDQEVKLSLGRKNFTAIGEEGAVGLTEENTTFSLADWINFDNKDLTLPPRQSRSVPFTIEIPPSAEPGGHFGSIVVKTVPTSTLESSGASLSQELGCLILLRIAGQVQENASLVSFSSTQDLYEYGPVEFSLRLQNNGSVHIRPTGTIVVTNLFGQQVASVPLEGKNILPGAIRQMTTTWDTRYGLGPYTATLVATYGTSGATLTSTATFYLLPYRIMLVITLILFILLVIILRSRKRLKLAFKVLFLGKV